MRENHSVAVEPKPQGVQVVERVGLVAFSFQFITRLAAVFAEEVGGFTGWFSTKSIGVSVLTVIAFTSALSVISNLILHAHFSSVFKNDINGSNTNIINRGSIMFVNFSEQLVSPTALGRIGNTADKSRQMMPRI